MISGVAVSMIAVFYARGGFGLVLSATAIIALGFLVAAVAIAFLANGVERERLPQPARVSKRDRGKACPVTKILSSTRRVSREPITMRFAASSAVEN